MKSRFVQHERHDLRIDVRGVAPCRPSLAGMPADRDFARMRPT